MVNELLLNEKFIIFSPSLAKVIGLNEAIMLQQMHSWLRDEGIVWGGDCHVYVEPIGWQRDFPFWSVNTMSKIISSLKGKGLLIEHDYGNNCYTIDYEKLRDYEAGND